MGKTQWGNPKYPEKNHICQLCLSRYNIYKNDLKRYCVIHCRFIKFAGINYPFKLVNNPSKEEKSVYQFHWSTKGIEPTENRHRTDVPCSMKFKPYKEIEFRLQVKFYNTKQERQATFGKQLNNVSLECTAGRGTYVSFVDKISLQ